MSGLFSFMVRLRRVIWFLIMSFITLVLSDRVIAHEQQAFSLRSNRSRPLWRNTTSQLSRRNPDAVSFHVDPNHNYAWTPVQLGGLYNPIETMVCS